MHLLVVGVTGMGKTLYCKALSRQYHRLGKPAIVLTPFAQDAREIAEWRAGFITDDVDQFVAACRDSRNRPVFIDEIYRYGKNPAIVELATMGRHYGLACHIIGQRQMHADINIRTQCTHLVMFQQSDYDCEELYRDFADPLIRRGDSLQKFEAIIKQAGKPARRVDIRQHLDVEIKIS